MDILNDAQRMVAEDGTHHILLTAPAGTGKTGTLARRIARLVEKGMAAPEEILCLTFTNKACREMEHRIQEYMGEKGQGVSVKTIHGFCYELIQAEADNPENRYVNLSVWDEEDCRELMDDILEKWNTRPGNERQMIRNSRYFFYDVDKAKRWLLERNRYTGEAADYLAAMNAISPNPFNVDKNRARAEMAASYDRQLHSLGGMDFNDILIGALHLLSDDGCRRRWSSRFRYLHVDEMQDMSMLEYGIVLQLASQARVLLAGDYFQTIYEWRGSDPIQLIQRFTREFHPEVYTFTENYRATPLLLKAAEGYLRNAFSKDIPDERSSVSSVREGQGEPVVIHPAFETLDGEARWIIQCIEFLVHKQKKLQEAEQGKICILCRNNAYNERLEEAFTLQLNQLKADGSGRWDFIRFLRIGEEKLYRKREVKDVLAALHLAVNPFDNNSARRLCLNWGKGIGEATVKKILSSDYRKLGIALSDFLRPDVLRYADTYGTLLQALDEGRLTVFDVESTGTSTSTDEIVQLAAVTLNRDGQVTARFNRMVKPSGPVGESEKIHHISDERLKAEGEPPEKVFADFLAFTSNHILAGHNVSYDIHILMSQMRRLGMDPVEIPAWVDTLEIFRRYYPELKNHKLEYLGEVFKVHHKSSHNAYDDILATAEILMYAVNHHLRPERDARRACISPYVSLFMPMARIVQDISRMSWKQNPNALIGQVISQLNMDEYFTQHGKTRERQHLEELKRCAEAYPDYGRPPQDVLQEYLAMTALDAGDEILWQSGQAGIPIATVHQAKGMEFDFVFMAGMADENFPSFGALKAGMLMEEKRLFYVAITRARKRLFISWNIQSSRFGDAGASRFIANLPKDTVIVLQAPQGRT
ncbi:DNA helicase-2 / ATP-dependent DNA helicase PcrA [Dialister histaminiformans]|uniref:DNA 3'-5' helicase n=1 Tax=Allisonella histaminiformans TaxID=209880 RepID=A0A1G5UUC9_9FIRM|nr:3'-5' exonuclease [Allisonella histaminiformans]SDA37221.1 DNA helicase-2 / ATP-dependent DNA helicase PcrA [Allisonella histaminiformans]